MSSFSEIQTKIDVIFECERSNLNKSKRFKYVEKIGSNISHSSNPNTPALKISRYAISTVDDLDIETILPEEFDLEWGTYKTLVQLYNKSSDRELFITRIKNIFLQERPILIMKSTYIPIEVSYVNDVSSLAFFFLLKIGRNEDLINILEEKYNHSTKCRIGLFHDIIIFLLFEPSYFDDSLLDALKTIPFGKNHDMSDYLGSSKKGYIGFDSPFLNIKNRFDGQIVKLKYTRLKQEIFGISEELNLDKEIVIDTISKLDFPEEMNIFLREIDKTPESSEWDSINSGMIGNLRSFYEELIRNIAESIKEKYGDEFPKNSSKGEMGNKRAYIKQHLELTKNDDKLISSYVSILHTEGGHAFLSEKKYYRLTKNIGIEIAYFLLSKLEVYLER